MPSGREITTASAEIVCTVPPAIAGSAEEATGALPRAAAVGRATASCFTMSAMQRTDTAASTTLMATRRRGISALCLALWAGQDETRDRERDEQLLGLAQIDD